MAALVLIGTVTALVATRAGALARRPKRRTPGENRFARVAEAAVGAFTDFLRYELALVVLAFVVLFKFTDALAGAMTAPFVIDLGFSRNEYAAIIKGVGLAATAARRLCRRLRGARLSARRPACGSAAFCRRSPTSRSPGRRVVGHDIAVADLRHHGREFHQRDRHGDFRRLSLGAVPNPLHTATQYALLTALAAVGRTYLSSGAGFIADVTGWVWFFAICALAGLPSLLLLAWLQRAGISRRCNSEARALIDGIGGRAVMQHRWRL